MPSRSAALGRSPRRRRHITTGEMTLAECDRTLRRLSGAAEQIRDNLLDIELDPRRGLLDGSRLEGESAKRWATTSAALLQLWEWHGVLVAHLERAVKLRGTRTRLRPQLLLELSGLIEGASIEYAGLDLPLARGHRSAGSRATGSVRPDELVERLSAGVYEAKAVLAQVGTAWDGFTPPLRRMGEMVRENSELCRQLGETEPQELTLARQGLTRLHEEVARDPLSVEPGDIEALKASMADLRAHLDAIAQLKGAIGERLAGARTLLEELRRAQREGEAGHADVRVKIAFPAVSEPVGLADIEAELDQVVELSEGCAWRQAHDALAQWTKRANSLLEQARTTAADHRAAIEARNQLRGRLEAYQAKVKCLGLLEDPELSGLFERAEGALYTAPTDLEHAEGLVRRYQRALASDSSRRERRT